MADLLIRSRLMPLLLVFMFLPVGESSQAGRRTGAGKGELRVTLLGTGNPRPSMTRMGPSILVEAGDEKILFDAGRGASIRLFQIGQGALLSSIDAVVLTHLHSDHTVGLPDLWLTGWIFGRTKPLEVFGPQGTSAMISGLKLAFESDVRFRRDIDEHFPSDGAVLKGTDTEPGVVFDRSGIKITTFAVDHGPVSPAYGYRIDYRGRSVVLSGDTRPSEDLVEHARGVDVLVHEVISPSVEQRRAQVDPAKTARVIAHHTTPEEAGKIFDRVRPRLAVYSHIVPSVARQSDLVPETRRYYRGRLVVGRDLMMITVGENIRVTQRKPVPDR